MEAFRDWILTATVLCLAGGMVLSLVPREGRRKPIQLLLGVLLLLSFAEPWKQLDWETLTDFPAPELPSGEDISQEGREMSLEAIARLIKAKYEAYVMEKAKAFSGKIQVDITLGEDFTPASAELHGDCSGEEQKLLETVLEQELGIPKEAQHWSG